MKFETAKALERLIGGFTVAIEAAGVTIPEQTVALIGTDPFKACEELNALAVARHALTPEADAQIAAIYESMDAIDARSEATPTVCDACAGTFARVHVEPEPEPEVVYIEEVVPEDAYSEVATPAETEKAPAESIIAPAPVVEDGAPATEKPKRARKARSTKKAEVPAQKAEAKPVASAESTSAEVAPEASEPFGGEVLTVDQAMVILGLSRPKLTKLIDSGALPAYKKGRSWQISASAVLDMAAANTAQ